MKHLLFFVFLLTCYSLNAQKMHPLPARADNAIIVQNMPFDSAVKKLTEQGYIMRVVDKEKKIAITNPSVSKLSIIIKSIKNGAIAISGTYYTQYFTTGSPDEIQVVYYKHGEIADHWKEMMKYAGTFSNIEYARL